jgi:hypothetical protein
MPYIAEYLLKLSLSLTVVYLFYITVLRRLTFYNWNRWYLMGYSVLAFFIPFINISPVLQKGALDQHQVIQLIPFYDFSNHVAVQDAGFYWWSFLLLGALAGILLMGIRFVVRYISYYRIRRSAELLVDVGVKVYHVDKSIIPFSFGNAIFINRRLHEEEDLRQIIHHEFIHVKQKHTFDIMWAELLCMLNWYNPFAWLIRKAVRQNLEFIADHKVLENGIDKKHYQYLLLKVTGAAHFSITQQFNFSSLKKRIIMMNRSRSAKIQLTRFMFLFPLLSIMLLAFRSNVIDKKRLEEVRVQAVKLKLKTTLDAKAPVIIDTVPAPAKQPGVREEFLKKNTDVRDIGWEAGEGNAKPFVLVVFRRDGIVEKYNWDDVQARTLFQKRYGSQPDLPKNFLVKPNWGFAGDKREVIDASLDGPGNPYLRAPMGNVLVSVNGVMMKKGFDLNSIDVDDIRSISILKGEGAVKEYGDLAKAVDGVIEIVTKSYNLTRPLDSAITLKADSIFLSGNPAVKIRGHKSMATLYVVDGIEFSPAEFEKLNLDPGRIESITVLKGESASKLYGQRGREGVIVIALKKEITKPELISNPNELKGQLIDSEQPIQYIDGSTYVFAGHSKGNIPGIVNTIIVKGKIYTADQANQLFTKGQFSGLVILTPEHTYKMHGIKVPAIVLASGYSEFSKYSTGTSLLW